MKPAPVPLDYGQPPQSMMRLYFRRTALAISYLLSVGLIFWLAIVVVNARSRYVAQRDYQIGCSALLALNRAPNTILFDPSAGPTSFMKPFSDAGGHGAFITLTIPTEPVVEKNLRLMQLFDSLSVYPFFGQIKSFHGSVFVIARIEALLEVSVGPKMLSLFVQETQMTPGTFPRYESKERSWITVVHFIAASNRPLPTVLTSRADAAGTGWTLALMVEGKPEWVHFDHSTAQISATASFGSVNPTHIPIEITY